MAYEPETKLHVSQKLTCAWFSGRCCCCCGRSCGGGGCRRCWDKSGIMCPKYGSVFHFNIYHINCKNLIEWQLIMQIRKRLTISINEVPKGKTGYINETIEWYQSIDSNRLASIWSDIYIFVKFNSNWLNVALLQQNEFYCSAKKRNETEKVNRDKIVFEEKRTFYYMHWIDTRCYCEFWAHK